jgi:hypothetical protein
MRNKSGSVTGEEVIVMCGLGVAFVLIIILFVGEKGDDEIIPERYQSIKEMIRRSPQPEQMREVIDPYFEDKKITNDEYKHIKNQFLSLTPQKKEFVDYLNGNSLPSLEEEYEAIKIREYDLKNQIQKGYKTKGEIPDFVFEELK